MTSSRVEQSACVAGVHASGAHMRVRIVRMRTLSACVEWVHRAGDYRQLLSSRPVLGIDQGGGLAANLPSRPCAARANGVISRDLPPGNMTRVDTAHIMAC